MQSCCVFYYAAEWFHSRHHGATANLTKSLTKLLSDNHLHLTGLLLLFLHLWIDTVYTTLFQRVKTSHPKIFSRRKQLLRKANLFRHGHRFCKRTDSTYRVLLRFEYKSISDYHLTLCALDTASLRR